LILYLMFSQMTSSSHSNTKQKIRYSYQRERWV
jgi:hypothetical protein